MFERRLYFHVDWLLLTALLVIAGIGIAMIYSTTYVTLPDGTGHAGPQVRTQVYALIIGLLAFVIFLTIDYRMLAEHSLFLYGGLIVLLLFVLVKGSTQMGAQRWIPIGPFNLQPSEFGRVVLALILAMYFGENRRGARNSSDLVTGAIFMVVPLLLIAKQPDLGTAVTLIPVFLGVAYLAGLQLRLLGIIALAALLMAPVAWKFALKDYQKARVTTFLDPDQDPRGEGYQQIQARITVGSGGLKGKGFRGGTQGQYKFLPVAHNDFIFSVLAEEQGYIGVLTALALYLFVILAFARSGPAREGPPRRVSRGRHHHGLLVPGDLQRRHVGRPRARQRHHPAFDELWRLVAHRGARVLRPDHQRADEKVHQLSFPAAPLT